MSKQSDLVTVARDAGASGYVNVAGDTMTGALALPSGGLNVGSGQLAVDASGRVLMPNQPAFHALGSGTQSWSGSFNHQIPALSTVQLNVGGHYNASTYRFTIPVSGVYFFYFKMADQTGTTGPQASLYVNSVDQGEVSIGYYTAYKTSTTNVLRACSANDVVDFRVGNYNNTSFTLDLFRCAFGGYLIG